MIIAIDGLSASGKSTMARQFAEATGFVCMDSGLMYRAVAFGFLKHGAEQTEAGAATCLPEIQLDVQCIRSRMSICIDGKEVTSQLHTPRITEVSSRVAMLWNVRDSLLDVQRGFARQFGNDPGIVAVGRDMGTVIFPDAKLKFFVTASLEVRARRRFAELHQPGSQITFQQVRDAIADRDRQDSERKLAPLQKAPDAVIVNTDHLTPEEQVQFLLAHL